MKSERETSIVPTASPPPPTQWRDRHPKSNEILICLAGPLLGAFPGGVMMWLVTGPVWHSNKLNIATIAELAFIAAGIAFLGTLLGGILSYVTLIYQKLSAINARLSPAPDPSRRPIP
jgi:hypothetical protein